MTALEVRDQVIAALNADPAATKANAYSPGELALMPDEDKPTFYTEVLVMEKVAQVRREGGRGNAGAYRLLTRAVAQEEDNAYEVRSRAALRLEELVITVDEVESTAIARAVPDNPIAPDDGWFSGLSEWSLYL